MSNQIRIVLADDQLLMREGLRTLLNLESDLDVIGTAENGLEAYQLVQELNPEVVLMDIRMPILDGVGSTRRIKGQFPEITVLMLTTFDDIELALSALKEGASGYLLKDMEPEMISQAIRTARAGGIVLPPNLTAQMVHMSHPATLLKPLDTDDLLYQELTSREKEILQLLGQGLNNREIAGTLFITEGTVKNHISSLIAKLQLRDRTQAAIFAVRNDL